MRKKFSGSRKTGQEEEGRQGRKGLLQMGSERKKLFYATPHPRHFVSHLPLKGKVSDQIARKTTVRTRLRKALKENSAERDLLS